MKGRAALMLRVSYANDTQLCESVAEERLPTLLLNAADFH